MATVAGFDVHRAQITFDALDTETGEVTRGRIEATPAAVARWTARLGGRRSMSPWRRARAGCWSVSARGRGRRGASGRAGGVERDAGRKRRAKTDREDARWLRELLADGRSGLGARDAS